MNSELKKIDKWSLGALYLKASLSITVVEHSVIKNHAHTLLAIRDFRRTVMNGVAVSRVLMSFEENQSL